jgi:hypothetical protein
MVSCGVLTECFEIVAGLVLNCDEGRRTAGQRRFVVAVHVLDSGGKAPLCCPPLSGIQVVRRGCRKSSPNLRAVDLPLPWIVGQL